MVRREEVEGVTRGVPVKSVQESKASSRHDSCLRQAKTDAFAELVPHFLPCTPVVVGATTNLHKHVREELSELLQVHHGGFNAKLLLVVVVPLPPTVCELLAAVGLVEVPKDDHVGLIKGVAAAANLVASG